MKNLIDFLKKLFGCYKNLNPNKGNSSKLKFEVLNKSKEKIKIIYSENGLKTRLSTSDNWQKEIVIFQKQSYFIVIESKKECTINLYINKILVKSITGKNMVDLNYSF